MTLRTSDDRTRVIDDSPSLALAAYEGSTNAIGFFRGRHVGVFYEPEDAERWLASGQPRPLPIYEPDGAMPRPTPDTHDPDDPAFD